MFASHRDLGFVFPFAGWGSHFEESRARVVSPGKKEDTMPAKKAKQSTIIDVIQRGDLSILQALSLIHI